MDLFKKDPKNIESSSLGQKVVSVTSEEGLLPKFDEQRLVCFVCGGMSQN